MAVFAVGSKLALFLVGYAVMRAIAVRRRRARIVSGLATAG
jgi:hypothetical protein